MNESLVKYLSGLADTDACLTFTSSKRKGFDDGYYIGLHLSIASSDQIDKRGFIKSLPALTGMGSVYQCGRHKHIHSWTVTKRSDLEKLLPRLIKHMYVKGRHWQWLLDTRREYRGVCLTKAEIDKLQEANRRSRAENIGPVKPKNHPTWAWLAGFLDGDGHFYHRTRKKDGCLVMYVGATVHENDELVLHWLQQAFGGRIYTHSKNARAKRWRRYVGLRDGSFALRFLPKIAKHSRIKRHKIDQMIHAHSQRLSAQRAAA